MKIKELLILILLVIPATLSLFKPGFFGASDDMHIAWLQQIDQSIKEGQIPPRYVSDLSFGFGYPLFNFIFPLPYYLGEIFHLVGLSFTYSIKAVFIFSLFASALTMYFLAKKLSGKFIGMAAAVLYTYTPYRSTDIYSRGALGESLAFIFLPLIILFLINLSESKNTKESVKWICAGSLSVAGLILTHNIVSYMFIPFAFLFGIFVLRRNLKNMFLLFFNGLLGSIYFWLPALLDSKLMKYETVFNFFDHFPTIKQLITPFWGYGASVPGPYDEMSFFIGEINLIIIIAIIIFAIFNFSKIILRDKLILGWSLFLIFSSILMMNFRSFWLWEKIPLIAYFQFPWRFLTMIVFASSLLVIFIKKFKYSKVIAVLIIVVSMVLNIGRFKPKDYLNRDDSYYINRYIPIPNPSQEYLTLQEEYLRLPKTNITRPKEIYPRIYPINNAVKNVVLINSLDAKFNTTSDVEIILNYNKYNFPGWKAYIDGNKLPIKSGDPYGQIQLTIPSGNHEILVQYRETIINKVLDYLSILTIIGCIFLIFYKKK